MRGRASEVHPAALKLDEEEHVVAAQERGLAREEVTGNDARRLCPQEVLARIGGRPGRRGRMSTTTARARGAAEQGLGRDEQTMAAPGWE
jgi:hypothetical protein